LKVDDVVVVSGEVYAWAVGENIVTAVVSNGDMPDVIYTVTVTYTA